MAASDDLGSLNEQRKVQLALMDDLLKQVDKEDRANVRKMDIYKEHASLLKEINMEIVEIGKANKTTVEALIQQESKLKGLTGLQANLVGLDRKRLKAQQSLGAGSQEALNNLADKNKEILALSAEDEISIGRLQAERNRLLDIVKQDASISEELTQNAKDQGEIADNTAKLSEKQQKHLTKQLEVYEGIKDTIGGILETASLLTSTVGGVLGGALIGAGAAGKALFHTMHELGGSIGATNTVATTLFSKVFPDAVGTVKELSKEFGGLSDVSLKTQFRTNVIAKNLGIGAGEAASLTGQFARLNDGSAETAQNLIMQTKNLAQQNGLVPTAVMADVANSAEEFALFGKEGGTNISEAAVAAGKLGVGMAQISGIADNLLDFESSINAELELGAMLGKNINLDKARALAMEGDLGGMVRETLSSLGGIDEFNKMDYFSKKKTAELLGVSVSEFQKMAANADKLGKNGEILPGQYEAMYQNAKAFSSTIFSGVQGLGSMAVAAGQMGFNLKDGLKSMKGMGGLKGKIGKFFGGGAAGPMTKAGKPDMRFGANKGAGLAKASKGGGIGGMMKGMGGGLKGMAKGFAAFANPATLLGLAAITAGIIGIGFALKIAAPGIEAIGKAIGSVVESVGNAVKTIIGGLGDFFMKVSSVATPELALSILGLAGGFYALTGSLATFAIAGIAAIPAMLAVSAFSAIGGGSLLGLGDSGDKSDETPAWVEELQTTFRETKDVYMDGAKVTAVIRSKVSKVGSNSYAI
tara:strand:- start:241 stop:2511 length:2271 start_codon:yes stop_codon:yes gene_type:complete